jgi:Nicotinamide mononucleotide transporter.
LFINIIFDYILEYLVSGFYSYYGLDWIAFLLGSSGLYLISEKKKIGFLFQAVSVVCATACSLMAGQFGFVASNIVTLGIVLYGYWNWKQNSEST